MPNEQIYTGDSAQFTQWKQGSCVEVFVYVFALSTEKGIV